MNQYHITIQELQALLKFDPETGLLFWIAPGKGRIKKKAAGTLEHNGYIGIVVHGKRIRAHILAWALYHKEWPKNQIDHHNRIKTDNRIINLREADNSQNGKNLSLKINNTSGHSGVSWDKSNKKWRASIKVNYKQIYLGRYDTIEEAIEARKQAEIKYFGEWRPCK